MISPPDSPANIPTRHRTEPPMRPADEPSQKPDWLLIMVAVLFVLTLSIAWVVSANA